jgi:DNA (cytosine-5)-methyltransferase 1
MARTAVDLFCGSGGVTAGLKAVDWTVLVAVDNDPVASATYRANHPEVVFVEDDIHKGQTIRAIKKAVDGRAVDLLVVCAPCQPFSSQNRKRAEDPRQQLLIRSLAATRALRPKLIFFENVPGLAGPRHRAVLECLSQGLRKLGYTVTEPALKDASSFGVPQRRRRCIMLAALEQTVLQTFSSMIIEQPKRTVYDAIERLPPLENGQAHAIDSLHRARKHSKIALERLRSIPRDGGSRKSLPLTLELQCHQGTNAFPDVYGRMSWHGVAPTLTTGCTDVTRGRFAHPHQDRAITLREAARLQTFDDNYVFIGNASQIATQIGNAVPPAMVAALAEGFEAALIAGAK